jgi:spore coat protein U-like protein
LLALLTTAVLLAPGKAVAAITCTVASLSSMSFNYDPSAAAASDTSASMNVTCSRKGGPGSVTLTVAVGTSAVSSSINPRQMLGASSGDRLAYNIFRDSGRSLVWGQTAGVNTYSVAVSGIPNNGSSTVPVTFWGRAAALQAVGAGSYSDSVVVTISP